MNTRERYGANTILATPETDRDVTPYNITRVGISFTLFIRAEHLTRFRFDERLGLGARFCSGEETDLILFLLKNGVRGRYHAEDFVYHPAKIESPERAYNYGLGFGAVHKKAVFRYGFVSLFPLFLLRLAKGILNVLVHRDRKTRRASLAGRVQGFLLY